MREQIKEAIDLLQKFDCDTSWSQFTGAMRLMRSAISPQWVPVTERLPTYHGFVFVRTIHDVTDITFHLGDLGWGGYDADEITHWHAIDYPEPPQAQP